MLNGRVQTKTSFRSVNKIYSPPYRWYRCNAKVSFCLLLYVILTIKTEADLSTCEQKEKHDAVLDLAKDAISKAKDILPTCDNGSKNISSNSSECGAKEKVSAYLDVALDLIKDAKANYSACDATNHTKVVRLQKKPVDCSEILENGDRESGVYTIWPKHRILEGQPLQVYCDMETDGGGWTMIQRRGRFSNKVDFYREWNDYKKGFGNITEEFWIGNDNIFALTNQRNYFARFDMATVDNEHFYAKYSSFWIEDENAAYALHFGNYNGTAGNGIRSSIDTKFSTKDRKNFNHTEDCVSEKQGGWWYSECGLSNPNGVNQPGGKNNWKYMNWKTLTEYDSLSSIEIKIRSED
ncbi:Techylectin-5A [Araneus ventricosus]|uniref:Techylectin-5A n=1 Tax=Araneus ventricosus TaxID=182803 RepID=A0A4Y2GW05_ARAVE|nr:Techylectin-5A [Araneus ventricosus]